MTENEAKKTFEAAARAAEGAGSEVASGGGNRAASLPALSGRRPPLGGGVDSVAGKGEAAGVGAAEPSEPPATKPKKNPFGTYGAPTVHVGAGLPADVVMFLDLIERNKTRALVIALRTHPEYQDFARKLGLNFPVPERKGKTLKDAMLSGWREMGAARLGRGPGGRNGATEVPLVDPEVAARSNGAAIGGVQGGAVGVIAAEAERVAVEGSGACPGCGRPVPEVGWRGGLCLACVMDGETLTAGAVSAVSGLDEI